MIMDPVLSFAKNLLARAVHSGDMAVDGTTGNGYDTVFLAELTGEQGHVYGFDVQEQAIMNTKERLRQLGLSERVTLFHCGHENMLKEIPSECHGQIKGAVFNLGYLPGSDKSIVTKPETTIAAIKQLLEIMASEGIIVIVIYHGHPGGAEERDSLLHFCRGLDQKSAHVLQYQFINQINHSPFIVAIEKI